MFGDYLLGRSSTNPQKKKVSTAYKQNRASLPITYNTYLRTVRTEDYDICLICSPASAVVLACIYQQTIVRTSYVNTCTYN